MPRAKKRFLTLDSFRGICALCVVVFHTSFSSGVGELEFFRKSNAFVDFFFVLSGFVMTHAYTANFGLTFRKYMISRIFRIAPLHIFLLAIFLLLEVVVLVAFEYGLNIRGEPFSGKSSVLEIIPNFLLVHAWTDFTYHLSFNGPSWSISVELFLYMAFFFTLFAKGAFKALVWISISFMAGYFYIYGLTPINDYLFRGLFSFFLGAIVYSIHLKNDHTNFNFVVASSVEIILVFSLVFVITQDSKYRFLFSGCFFALMVFFFAFEKGVLSKILKMKPFVFVGVLSYSIYMTHYLVLSIFKASVSVVSKLFSASLIIQEEKVKSIDLGNPGFNSLATVIIVAVVIFISTFTYRHIEKRGIKIGKGFL